MTQLDVRPPFGPPPSGPPPSADGTTDQRGLRRLRLPGSLTARLVVTAVALVAVVCLLIAAVTTLAMRNTLLSRLDDDLRTAAASVQVNDDRVDTRSVAPGTLIYFVGDNVANGAFGGIVGSAPGPTRPVPDATVQRIAALPVDAQLRTVDLPQYGSYRVVAEQTPTPFGNVTKVVGLPLREVHDTLRNLIVWEAALTLLGIAAAAVTGLVLVRRQLRPLREVAATAHTVARQPLASGEVGEISRVPARLTDSDTEVGQVGAALNTLLDHVEVSLEARHQSEQQVRQFVADASHELRTPLTTIRGYTELAQRRPQDAEAAATALAKVAEESGRMTSLVEDLLLLARLDQGRPLERDPVDLSRLLLEAVSDARVVAPDHHWVLALPEEPVEVTGDEQRLHQVVSNLLANARAYTPPGTTVTVSAHDRGFVVHDDGPGFPPDLVPVAFERFTRGDSGRQREGAAAGGAGLGLSLVQAIVASHGGSVSLASAPGDTSISVRLPR